MGREGDENPDIMQLTCIAYTCFIKLWWPPYSNPDRTLGKTCLETWAEKKKLNKMGSDRQTLIISPPQRLLSSCSQFKNAENCKEKNKWRHCKNVNSFCLREQFTIFHFCFTAFYFSPHFDLNTSKEKRMNSEQEEERARRFLIRSLSILPSPAQIEDRRFKAHNICINISRTLLSKQ